MDELLESYEEAPYPGEPVYQTHPDALATPAHLVGMSPTPVDKSRVLELGCGTGDNLIAMAMAMPESHFIGIDLSPRQIATGQATVDELGLKNLQLRAGDILQMGAELGELDYILCHGVYSWCPPVVQQRILTLCRDQLAPHGVGYISYNVLPGWRRIGVWRDIMRWGARHPGEWRNRVREGKRFMQVVQSGTADQPYGDMIRTGIEKLRKLPESYLMHEFLESFNEPMLFHEMVSRAEAVGLQYLGESCRQTDLNDLPPPVREWLTKTATSDVEVEQYLDFFRNASFRRSLFCRAEVALEEMAPSRLAGLHFNILCEPASKEPDVRTNKAETFRAEMGQVTTDVPLVKAILVSLFNIWPRTFTLAELCSDVRARLDAVDDPELGEEVVAEAALQCYTSNLLAAHVWKPPFTSTPGERPLANPLARLQAKRGSRDVTNLRHRNVDLNPFELALLVKLDGTRDRATLIEEMVRDGEAGAFVIEKGGIQMHGAESVRPLVAEGLPATLGRLAHGALLSA